METLDLEDYTKLEKIGFGSFGEVFKIKNNDTSKIYAAKISSTSFDDADDSEEKKDLKKNLKREITIISKIHHPSILRLIGMSMTDFNNDSKPVIVTEYFSNGSLNSLLRETEKGLAPDEWNDTIKLIIVYGIASSMSFLHSNKILHRDLKPDNILLDEYLFPILADFGLSKDENVVKTTSEIKGTPLYIAPEIWEENDYSEKSDVYAFAFILFEIYANQNPYECSDFEIKSAISLANKIIKGLRPDTSLIEEPFKELIEKCWHHEPFERPSFDEIVELLENNDDFITENVEKEDFLAYVSYIKKSKKSFNKKVEIDPFSLSKTKIIKKVELKKKMIYPKSKFIELSKSCQKKVNRAIEDADEQYKVGSFLINGEHGFPKNTKIGVKYLKQAIKGGSIESVILYNRLLIIGKKIEGNIKEAKKNLEKYNELKNPEIIFLQAMIEKKEENYPKAIKLLKVAKKAGIGEAMFEYGKLLYLGQGIDENKEKANHYFKEAKKNDCNKSDKFLSKQEKEVKKKSKSKYDKKIDLVFLIDGQVTNKFFYKALQKSFKKIANKCIKIDPKILFRFGVVIYRDFIVSVKTKTSRKEPIIIDLTQDIEEVISFLNDYTPKHGGPKSANDWAYGYHALNKEISWDKKAEKVVIQIGDSPSYSNVFMMRSDLRSKYFNVPKKMKFRDYKEMLVIQNGWFIYNIAILAKKGVKFYCINGRETALYCYDKVSKKYKENGGVKFIVNDIFGFTVDDDDDDSVDFNTLKMEFIEFVSKVIYCCTKSDDNEFEEQCEKQFSKDLKKFLNKNPHRSKSVNKIEIESDDSDDKSDDSDDKSDDSDDKSDDSDDKSNDSDNKSDDDDDGFTSRPLRHKKTNK